MTFPSKAAAHSWKAEVWKNLLLTQLGSSCTNLFLLFVNPSLERGKNPWTSKLREVHLKLQQDMPLASVLVPALWVLGGREAARCGVVISWAAKPPNNSLVSPILSIAPVPGCAPS